MKAVVEILIRMQQIVADDVIGVESILRIVEVYIGLLRDHKVDFTLL